MKELSVEEKAQRYDEAIKRIENIKTGKCETTFMFTEGLFEYIFPELAESEDERIRKEMIDFLQETIDNVGESPDIWTMANAKKWLAWLEKQGKNNMGISEATKQKLEDNLNKALEKETPESWNEFLEGQGEQKPTWSEEDQKIWEEISDILWEGYKQSCSKFSWDDIRNWLKPKIDFFKDRVQPQPKQERNEDTQQWIDAIIRDYEEWYKVNKDHRATIQIEIDILKSLKERYTWKPSDEQMDALQYVYRNLNPPLSDKLGWNSLKTLELMYQDLKKLKEEQL